MPYHHGDLRNALVAAGVELAGQGGPSAVLLREAARRVGVSHNAGYRHFPNRDAYLDAVAAEGLRALGQHMAQALAAVDDPTRQLRTVGHAYLGFALAHPGLFRTAFAAREAPVAPGADLGQHDPYALLVAAVDALVDAGVLDPAHRPHTELAAWSAVHGLAALLLDGPLRGTSPDQVEAAWQRLAQVVEAGVRA